MKPVQSLVDIIKMGKEKVNHFQSGDERQQKALGNLARFFAVMLVLTLIARGTAAATVPWVDVVYPTSGEIVQQVSLQGTVSAAGRILVACPEGLTVSALLVKEGEQVSAGQPIVQFSSQEVSLMLQRARAQVQQLNAQIASQSTVQQPDAGTVGSAQLALEGAYQDLATAQSQLDALAADPSADPNQLEQARQAVDAATRAAQSAEYARDSALNAYQQQQQQTQLQAQTNEASVASLSLDIKELEAQIEQLQALQTADCMLTAPSDGTLLSWNLTQGSASTAQACTLSDGAQGYVMESVVSQQDAQKAVTGASVQVRQGDLTCDAQLSALSAADAQGNVQLTVRLPDTENWSEGAATGTLTLSRTQHDICLPASSLGQDNSGYFVYTLEERQTVLGLQTVLVRTSVALEERGTDQVAVTGPLASDTRVVSGSSKPLSDGVRVRVRT